MAGGRLSDPRRRAAAGVHVGPSVSEVLAHECGHTWQALRLGPVYLPLVGSVEDTHAALAVYKTEFAAKMDQLLHAKLGLRTTQADDAQRVGGQHQAANAIAFEERQAFGHGKAGRQSEPQPCWSWRCARAHIPLEPLPNSAHSAQSALRHCASISFITYWHIRRAPLT